MRRILRISAVILAVAFLAAACSREGGRIIPRAKMSKIYAEMFLTDQWILVHTSYLSKADTTLVYEPIFNKYGYTSADFCASRAYYLYDTERYARMIRKSAEILESQQAAVQKRKDIQDAIEARLQELRKRGPVKIYFMSGMHNREVFTEGGLKFYLDTNGGEWMFDPAKDIDTLYKGPVLVFPEPFDSVKFRADSLALADSLARVDSLARADSLAREDSIARAKAAKPEKPAEIKVKTVKNPASTGHRVLDAADLPKRIREKQDAEIR